MPRTREPHPRFDVAILGGGPAGSHLALRLARQGRRIALIEARAFPRLKPCGEFMSPECLGMLEELGLKKNVERAEPSRISEMELHGFGCQVRGSYLSQSLRPEGGVHGFALRREVLDEITLRAAAAKPEVTLFEGRRATGILRDAAGRVDGCTLGNTQGSSEEIRADFTIGADGLRSLIAREMEVFHPVDSLKKLAFVFRFEGVPPQNHAEIHLVDGGYLIAAPVDNGLFTLNLIVETDLWTGDLDKWSFFQSKLSQAPHLATKLEKAKLVGKVLAVGPLASRTEKQVFDGAALVGDACGFVDPFTGEGLYFAMRGAALLAPVLDQALRLRRRDAAILRPYARARRREFGPRFFLARCLQRGLRNPKISRRVLSLLAARPGLFDLLLTVTGDSISPLKALHPRVLFPALLQKKARKRACGYTEPPASHSPTSIP